MKVKYLAGVLVGVALCSVACGSMSTGVVESKSYDEGYTYFIPISTGNSTVLMPQFQPECWALHLHEGDETGSVCVDVITWKNTKIGDTYHGS